MDNIKWSEIIESNREALEDQLLETIKDMYNVNSSHYIDIEINQEGRIFKAYFVNNGQTMESYKGETCIVAKIFGWIPDYDENLEELMEHKDIYSKEYWDNCKDEILNKAIFENKAYEEWN
jgi:hypothetical protein